LEFSSSCAASARDSCFVEAFMSGMPFVECVVATAAA
jgi:hypothetical protein